MMKLSKIVAALSIGLSVVLTSCSADQVNEAAGLLDDTSASASDNSSTDSGSATGSSSTDSNSASSSSTSGDNIFAEFLKPGDTYFGPLGADAQVDSGVTGNDAAGSRYGGPDDQVGVLIVVRNARGYMEVVNLKNKRRFPVVNSTDGSNFSVPTDTLGGKPFVSIYVLDIPTLTEFSFDRRFPGATPKCNRYDVTYSGTAVSGKYTATKQGETGTCRVKF